MDRHDHAGANGPRSSGDTENVTADADKQYHYDVPGPLALVRSAFNSNAFLAGMAKRSAAMVGRRDPVGDAAMPALHDCTHDSNAHYDESNITPYYYDTSAAGGSARQSQRLLRRQVNDLASPGCGCLTSLWEC